jgi:hypothetical protein
VSQPWYADVRVGAGFTDILAFFERMKEIRPWYYGYYPEALKSITVICQHNLEVDFRARQILMYNAPL